MGVRTLENTLKYSILTPTRNRPHRLQEFVQSVYNLAHQPEHTEHLIYVDNDDPAIHLYRQLENVFADYDVHFVYGFPVTIRFNKSNHHCP